MILTLENIQNALSSHDPSFFLSPELLAIIEEATKRGYVRRISHTQAEWIKEGLEKAKIDLGESPMFKKDINNHSISVYLPISIDIEEYLKLISAAPEMLEACKIALETTERVYDSDYNTISALKEAIEKATL